MAKHNDIAPFERRDTRRWTRFADYWPENVADVVDAHLAKTNSLPRFPSSPQPDQVRKSRRGLILPTLAVALAALLSLWGSGALERAEDQEFGDHHQPRPRFRTLRRRRADQLRRQRRQLLPRRKDGSDRRHRSAAGLRRTLSQGGVGGPDGSKQAARHPQFGRDRNQQDEPRPRPLWLALAQRCGRRERRRPRDGRRRACPDHRRHDPKLVLA